MRACNEKKISSHNQLSSEWGRRDVQRPRPACCLVSPSLHAIKTNRKKLPREGINYNYIKNIHFVYIFTAQQFAKLSSNWYYFLHFPPKCPLISGVVFRSSHPLRHCDLSIEYFTPLSCFLQS